MNLLEAEAAARDIIVATWSAYSWSGPAPVLFFPGVEGDPAITAEHGIVAFTGLGGKQVGVSEPGGRRYRTGRVVTVLHRYAVGGGTIRGGAVGQLLIDAFRQQQALPIRGHRSEHVGVIKSLMHHRTMVEFDHDEYA